MKKQEAIGILQLLRPGAIGSVDAALSMAIECLKQTIIKADIDSIISAVTRETGITEEEMVNKGRHREYSDARAIVSWLAIHYTHMSKTSIGRRINRSHSSVVNYKRIVDGWLEEPRRNIKGARIATTIIRELDDNKESN
jgi:chromosomal replication initiation ATPase DnaA